MKSLSVLAPVIAIALGLLAAAFAFAVAHDTGKPSHRRVAQWILLATLVAIPVVTAGYVVQAALANASLQFGGKYSTTFVTFRQSPLRFSLSGFIALLASALPLATAWPVIATLFKGKRDAE